MSIISAPFSYCSRSTQGISRHMTPGIEGIKIRGSIFKLSQFADDTSMLLGNKKEIKHANKAIRDWCDATGMRENAAKREGLAMGRYRQPGKLDDHSNIKWAQETGWCISLGKWGSLLETI